MQQHFTGNVQGSQDSVGWGVVWHVAAGLYNFLSRGLLMTAFIFGVRVVSGCVAALSPLPAPAVAKLDCWGHEYL
jgi:hypothetical protein